MSLKNFTQFTPQTLLSATDYLVGYRSLDEIRTDLNSMSLGVSAQLISKGFLPGTVLGSVKRDNFIYTIASGNNLNAVSGFDDNNRYLSYTPKQVEVYRNGSHLVDNQDFQAINSTQITNLSTLNVGDVIEVVGLSGIGATLQTSLTGFIGNLVQQNYRYSVAPGNTITPGSTVISGPDDFRSNLFFSTKCFQVYLNGSHLVKDYDYSSYNLGSSLTLATPVSTGDSVVVLSLSACAASSLNTVSAFTGISKILGGDRVTVSSGTGNVTVSSQTCISDILVPSWTDGKHISQFSLLQNYLSAVAASNTNADSSAYINYMQYPAGVTSAAVGVLHPNGKLYVSANSSYVCIVDPEASTVSAITLLAGRGLGVGFGESAVLGPNGKIYFLDQGPVVCFDPSNNSSTTFGNFTFASSPYEGGVLAPNGKIYFIPDEATAVLRVDPDTNTATTLGNMLIGGSPLGFQYYQGGVLAPNGKIYLTPNYGTRVAIIDPATDTVTVKTYANILPNGYLTGYGGRLAPNGKIYMFSSSTTVSHAILDPVNDTVTTIGVFPPGDGAFQYGPRLAPNGKFYGGYLTTTYLTIFDPQTNSQQTILGIPGLGVNSYYSPLLSKTGKLVFMGFNATNILVINFLNNNNWNINVATNPFFNKV